MATALQRVLRELEVVERGLRDYNSHLLGDRGADKIQQVREAATACPRCGHRGDGDCSCPEPRR
jgi:hypothetical protein